MEAEKQKLQLSYMRKLMAKAEAARGDQKIKIMKDIKELQASMANNTKKRPVSDSAAGTCSNKRPRSGPILSGGPVRAGGHKKRTLPLCRFGAACKRKGRGCKFSHVEKVEKVHLPIMDHKGTLTEAFDRHVVSIVSGDTGCGKSTQVPQIIMEHNSKAVVVCTQPRRLAAIALAERVAAERGEEIGNSVGYRISRNSKVGTRCTFMTIGLLLQLLIHQKDEALEGVTHVVIDEAHEREVDLDLVLTVLKRILIPTGSVAAPATPREPPFRLIIMSATFNADIFAGYFAHVPVRAAEGQSEDATGDKQLAPVLKVGAKCFPVTSIYTDNLKELPGFPALKDTGTKHGYGEAESEGVGSAVESGAIKLDKKLYDAAVWILQHLRKMEDGQHEGITLPPHSQAGRAGGAVLVFCPGAPEIYDLLEAFAAGGIDDRKFVIIPLHGLLEDKQQDEIFRPPPYGKRKVIIGTNIAESSITVNDISYIIDLGLEKLPYFDPKNNADELQLRRASQASAAQRAGRAGRVAEGTCFRLYSRLTFDTAVPAFASPEMVRCSLVNLVLKVKLIEPNGSSSDEADSRSLLAECLQPPSLELVEQALNQLTFLGATSRDGRVTTLGVILSRLPQLDLRIARLLLIAHAFDCIEDGATIAAGLAAHQDVYVQPFVKPASGEDKAFAKLRTDWDFAQQDVKHFAPKLGRTLETGMQSAPVTVLRLYNDWVTTRDAEGRDSAKEFAQAECASAKRLHQVDLMRQDLIRRLKKEGFGKPAGKRLNASATTFIPGNSRMDIEVGQTSDDPDSHEERAGGGQGVAIGGGEQESSTSVSNVPDEEELLYKALLVAAFCPNYAVGVAGPQQRLRVDGFDLTRTVIYKLQRSEPPASTSSSSGPLATTGPQTQAPEDFTVNMPALQSAMETCCYSNDPPRLVLRTAGQEHFLVVEFPSEHAAILGVRLVGLRRQLAVFGGPRVPGGGLPLLTNPVYSRKLSFSRPAHKTEMDHASGEARGHLVEMHWQSCCAILHTPANATTRVEAGDADYSPREDDAMTARRYLVTPGFQRAGVSKNRLLAMHPTLLSGYPMVAELTLLLFAREASWLVATLTSGNVLKTELAGAEIGSGDDSVTLIFTAVLTEEDIHSINNIRTALSNRLGSNLGGSSTVEGAKNATETLRSQLFTLLLAKRPMRAQEPPKPWRRVAAATLTDWDSLWSPLRTLEQTTAEVEQQLLKTSAAKMAASRAAQEESIW